MKIVHGWSKDQLAKTCLWTCPRRMGVWVSVQAFLEAQWCKRLRVRAEEIPGFISAAGSGQVTESKSSSSFVQWLMRTRAVLQNHSFRPLGGLKKAPQCWCMWTALSWALWVQSMDGIWPVLVLSPPSVSPPSQTLKELHKGLLSCLPHSDCGGRWESMGCVFIQPGGDCEEPLQQASIRWKVTAKGKGKKKTCSLFPLGKNQTYVP